MKRVAMIILLLAAAITMRAEEPVKTINFLGNDKLTIYDYKESPDIVVLEDISDDVKVVLVLPADGAMGRLVIINPTTGETTLDHTFKVHKETNASNPDANILNYVMHTDMTIDVHVYADYNEGGSINIRLLKK